MRVARAARDHALDHDHVPRVICYVVPESLTNADLPRRPKLFVEALLHRLRGFLRDGGSMKTVCGEAFRGAFEERQRALTSYDALPSFQSR